MCGIAGIIGKDLDSADTDIVEEITTRIQKRGPDGRKVSAHLNDGFVVGHTRLAVIDLSTTANQPFVDIAETTYLLFNGEIYNYIDLRYELENKGFAFETQCDTEVILKAYLAYGQEVFAKLRGMFAICLIDLTKNEYFLARDRFGVKPLYYTILKHKLYFCSSQRVLADRLHLKDNDHRSPSNFRFQGFIVGPDTVNSNIKMLEGGTVLNGSLDLSTTKTTVAYFSYKSDYANRLPKVNDLTRVTRFNQLGESILEVVEKHLVSDVPVGLFLSGGIDSAILLAAINILGCKSAVLPISIAFESQTGISDETVNASKLCKHYGIDLKVKRYNCEEVLSYASDLFSDMDQPSLDGANTWLASKYAHECGLKVVLSGLGGDEIFCGYPSFTRIPLLIRYQSIFLLLAKIGGTRFISKLLKNLHLNLNKLPLLESCNFSPTQLYIVLRSLGANSDNHELFREFMATAIEKLEHRIPNEFRSSTLLTKISNFETFYYMENQLLRDSDWASMAHSIELRVPFVDEELFQTTRFLYKDQLYTDLKKDLAKNYFNLPSYIWDRPKTGFGTPVAEWFGSTGISYSQRIADEFGLQ